MHTGPRNADTENFATKQTPYLGDYEDIVGFLQVLLRLGAS